MKFSQYVLVGLLAVANVEATCVDKVAGCQSNWCADSYWASQCEATCGGCDAPTPSGDCVDIQTGCQANWCGDEHWASQCKRTCNKCGDGSPTVNPVSPTPQPSAPTTQPVSPTPQPSTPTVQPVSPTPQTPSGDCVDIQTGCQAHWCGDEHWASQCKRTCNKCGDGSPTVNPVSPTPQPSAPTVQPVSPTTQPPTNTVQPKSQAPTISSPPSTAPPAPKGNGKKYVMYYPAWATYARNFQVADIDASKLTHINYAFANIANGECVLGDAYADTQKFFASTDSWNDPGTPLRGNFNQLKVLKEKYPHLVSMISLGGWTWSTHFSQVASTEESRVKFAESCADFMLEYSFDGIDIDWEFPVSGGMSGMPHSPNDRENFNLLLKTFRETLDKRGNVSGKHYPLTIATSADPAKAVTSYDVPNMHKYLDFANIMTYDFNGAWSKETGHNAPLYANPAAKVPQFNVDAGVQAFLNEGLPKEKLVLGLAFYGRGWSGAQIDQANPAKLFPIATGASKGTWEAGVLDYSDIVENYLDKGYTRYWDDVSKVPYLVGTNGEWISYDDEESICIKSKYVNDKDLGGAMVWEVTSDYHRSLQKVSFDAVVLGQSSGSCSL